MNETAEDIAALQAVLGATYDRAGAHTQRIHTPDRRLTAEQLCERLTGMCLLTLATVTRDGRPLAGPVDGIFHRGAFHFGSAPDSLRFRHIAERPQVSAVHLPGEHLAVTVHGRAELVDTKTDLAFRQALLDIYVPQYGESWEARMLDGGALYARIVPERMLVFAMD